MKNKFTIFLAVLLVSSLEAQFQKGLTGFTENKGQVSDQNGLARPDVLFSCTTGDMACHLRKDGISYQLSNVESWRIEKDETRPDFPSVSAKQVPERTSVYRLDLQWLNCNPAVAVETDAAFAGSANYFLAVCPEGVSGVKTYAGLVYKNLYPQIDLHYYLSGGNLKYDYLVNAYADYRQIKIKIKGAEKITLEENGSVTIQTPLGEINEAPPLVYQNKKQLPAKWVLKEDELSFSVSNYDPAQPLLIDPVVRGWGTFYGGSGVDEARSCATDLNGNVYMAGKSNSGSAIATSGGHKTTLSGTSYDAFLVKFNTTGVCQWATYYGGAGDDLAYACATDPSGNVYLTGQVGATSTLGISTPGAQQVTHGGGNDAFLVKFNSSGTRLWATYYGSGGTDAGEGLVVDPLTSDVYMSGYNSGAVPATILVTPGAHQTTAGSAMLIKFNSAGVRLWGTFYGNSQWSHAYALAIDGSGNIYMGGYTDATGGISTLGAHQASMLGAYDGYLVKFNSAGVRQWGTYYGDVSIESVGAAVTDLAGNVYMVGSSGSPTGIASTGAHQTVIGMQFGADGMIVKFNSAGVRQWATYYGGTSDDFVAGCVIALNGDLYVSGYSQSPSAGTIIATANGYQPSNAGYGDAFLARFTTAGVRVSGTYYGETNNDVGYGCAADANNNIYVTGIAQTCAGTGFPSPGCHQSAYGGGFSDAFLVQFKECSGPASPVDVTAASNLTVCSGGTTTLSATGSGTINWYNAPTSATSLGTGTVFITPALSAGTNTFFASATNSCSPGQRVAIMVTALALPSTTISAGSKSVCPGVKSTLTASGASQYTWNTGGSTAVITVTPGSSTNSYTVIGTSPEGCKKTATITIQVINCSGLEQLSAKPGTKVFPNPFNETLTLESSGAAELILSNALGQELKRINLNAASTQIDLSDLKSGVYLLEIRQGNSVEVRKIVKE